jgi:hypothetical protein
LTRPDSNGGPYQVGAGHQSSPDLCRRGAPPAVRRSPPPSRRALAWATGAPRGRRPRRSSRGLLTGC